MERSDFMSEQSELPQQKWVTESCGNKLQSKQQLKSFQSRKDMVLLTI